MHNAEKMIHCLRFAWYAGSASRLQQLIKHALTSALSPLLMKGICTCLEMPKKTPSKSSVKRYRLVLDSAFLQLSPEENKAANRAGCVRYLWADSSPSRYQDWLWVEQHSVQSDDQLHSAFRASIAIAKFLQSEGVDPLDMPGDIWQALETLASAIKHHIHTPVGLGSGKKMSDATQKASAMAHTFALENPTWTELHSFLDSFISITTDLGAESALAHLHIDLRQLMPPWHVLHDLMHDGEDLVIAGDDNPVPGQRYFLPNALPVVGMQHCVHNLLKEVHLSLQYWDSFWQQLKNFESLLNWPFRRKQLIMTCIRGTPYEHVEGQFEAFSQTLCEKRWHEVSAFVGKLAPLLGPLRCVWDAQRFQSSHSGGMDGDGDGGAGGVPAAPAGAGAFDPNALSQCLQSAKFAAYVCLVRQIEQCPEELASWAEGCYCHEKVLQDLSLYKRREILNLHYESAGTFVCPMAGKRAPELAAGQIEHVYQGVCEQALSRLLLDARLPLPQESQQEVISELQRAQAHVKLLLRTKLQHWQRMPWLACGLAHHDESVARRIAGEILFAFEECSETELHHRLTQQFLHGPLHGDLVRFAGGLLLQKQVMLSRQL